MMTGSRARLARLMLAAGVLAVTSPVLAQTEPQASTAKWRAAWISAPSAPAHGPGVYYFRRSFDLASRPATFPVRVTADNRYRLFVNGVEVLHGPARGDQMHWNYETVDLAAYLRAGRNVVAAQVWDMGALRPAAQVSVHTGFLIEGLTEQASLLDSGPGWKVLQDAAYTFAPVVGDDTGGFYVAGPEERLDAEQYPWGWSEIGYDDTAWAAAEPVSLPFGGGSGQQRGSNAYGGAAEWQLVPRAIPMPEQRPVRFAAVRRASGVNPPPGFVTGQAALEIPPHTKASLLLDNGTMTIGYPVLRWTGGEGARASLTYAESLFDANGAKGDRNAIEGKTIRGLHDRIRFDGGEGREFRSLWLRAWRYMQIDVETGDHPLRIDDVHGIFSAYPFVQRASFASSAASLKPIWDMNWRALRISAYETFWDTPYYEQLQYIGDTRIESLLSVYQSGDDRLMRNAIEQFDNSRLAEGLTASSWPSGMRQQIPPFSLWWIAMVHDTWMLRGDQAFVRQRLDGVRAVIGYYEKLVDETGMVKGGPWWNFVDWAKSWSRGVPPGGDNGHSTAITLQLVYALQRAADLERALGNAELAQHDAAMAQKLIAAIRERAWDSQCKLFVDAPEARSFSQQTNALAVLTGSVPDKQDRAVMQTVLSDPSLEQATFYFRFYVDEAMRAAGMADGYLDRLQPWKDMIRNGLTTTAETPEPSRSDSHAWSAHPNYQLLATVLGIRPASPGFGTVEIAPSLGRLSWASGAMPHPKGRIEVALRRKGQALQATVSLPPGVDGVFRLGGTELPIPAGQSRIECRSACRRLDSRDSGRDPR